MYPSTISSVAVLIWKALESYGCDSGAVFERAGVDAGQLRDANARYPITAMTRLWKSAVEISQDPSFGLTAARFWHPTTFHALGYSWLASETLRDAFDRLVRYSRIVSSAAAPRLEESAEGVRLILDTTEPELRPADAAVDAGLAIIVGMCRISYGADFNPLRVTMRRASPANRAPFTQVFRAPIQFSAPKNMFVFSTAELSTPLSTANAELARTNDRVITNYLARFDRNSIKMQVEVKLLEQLSSGHASQESVAKALNLSSRSLQRKLKQEGTTYKQLLELTRRELAAQYVKRHDLSINEITFLLGFSEPANFSRAFKRWTGVTPSEYRLS